MKRIAVLIACYNRREITLNCLDNLYSAIRVSTNRRFVVFLLDDASTDGTWNAVKRDFPSVILVRGNGNLFWNRGMCAAYKAAEAYGEWDTFVLINDDLDFTAGDFLEILGAYEEENLLRPTIMVGPVNSRDNVLLYGGYRLKNKLRPLCLSMIAPEADRFVEIDTMNGNLVFIPGSVMNKLGGLDSTYHHGLGDTDLGYRARKIGVALLLYSRIIGTAPENPPAAEVQRYNSVIGRAKYYFFPPNDVGQYAYFMWQHGNRLLFPFYVANTIIRRCVVVLFPNLIRRRRV